MMKLIGQDDEREQVRGSASTREARDDRHTSKKQKPSSSQQQSSRNPTKASMAFVGADENAIQRNNQQKGPRPCLFCSKTDHKLQHCPKTQPEKWNMIRERKLCGKCFQSGHFARACNAENCRKCQKKHHTFICPSASPNFAKTETTSIISKSFPAPQIRSTSAHPAINALATREP